MKQQYIFIKTTFKSYHKYDNAPYNYSFLKNLHRHIFHLIIYIEVNIDKDRDIEFFYAKDIIDNLLKHEIFKTSQSCESYSSALYELMKKQTVFKNRKIIINLSEDDENGTVTIFNDNWTKI